MAKPKKKAMMIKLVYEAQSGVNPTDIVHKTRQRLFKNNESTDGKSAT